MEVSIPSGVPSRRQKSARRSIAVWRWCLVIAVFSCIAGLALGVDRSKFRTCAKTGFCTRQRNRVESSEQYHVLPESFVQDGDLVRAQVAVKGSRGPLDLSFQAYKRGVLRMRITEPAHEGLRARYESPDILLGAEHLDQEATKLNLAKDSENKELFAMTSSDGRLRAIVHTAPFRVLVEDPTTGRAIVKINSANMLHFDQRKPGEDGNLRTEQAVGDGMAQLGGSQDPGRKIIDWGEDGKPVYEDGQSDDAEGHGHTGEGAEASSNSANDPDASESFGGHTDAKPHGATSVGLDVTFVGCKHVYGIPEHAAPFDLKNTQGPKSEASFDEPYRNYNLDVFEYEIDEPMALYGHIPLAIGHSVKGTASVFWNNPSETYVDLVSTQGEGDRQIHWMSETGVVDLMVMVGPTPKDIFQQYASLTGTTPLPPMFSLAYHQSRWNYRDEKDVEEVNANFEKANLPYDVLWLDIEHTDGKRYFTWDQHKFATPEAMQGNIKHYGRKMVTIVDPHIKRDSGYHVHKEAERKGYYIKDKDGKNDFKGWCWPGDSSYLDFTSAEVRQWWSELFSYNKYKGSTDILYTWNDMNEPSVFNGPEVSMTKEARSLDGWEHREWHNLYGFYHHWATAEGLIQRNPNQNMRPFVLSRSFFAGSQRFGAIWTGDNAAKWSHLRIASDMLLSLNVAGLPFAGADVGGFFGNPDEELLQRWYQAAAFQPFFRAHAHIDTKRREPYLYEGEVLERIRKTINLRYSLLPFWYTLFNEHEQEGMPVMRPLWSLAPQDERTFTIGDQWLLGEDLLVKAVTEADLTSTSVYLPQGFSWYQFEHPYALKEGGQDITEDAPLDKIPVFLRAGAIVPRKMRVRRSSQAMRNDPYTLMVGVDSQAGGVASGNLYVDDELTFDYRKGASCFARFALEKQASRLTGTVECGSTNFKPSLDVERVVILGMGRKPTQVTDAKTKEKLDFIYEAETDVMTIRKPIRSFIKLPFTLNID